MCVLSEKWELFADQTKCLQCQVGVFEEVDIVSGPRLHIVWGSKTLASLIQQKYHLLNLSHDIDVQHEDAC